MVGATKVRGGGGCVVVGWLNSGGVWGWSGVVFEGKDGELVWWFGGKMLGYMFGGSLVVVYGKCLDIWYGMVL